MRLKFITYIHNIATISVSFLFLVFGWVFNNQTGWGIFYTLLFFLLFEAVQIIFPLHSLKTSFHEQFVRAEDDTEFLRVNVKGKQFLWFPRFTVQIYQEGNLCGEGKISSHNFKGRTSLKIYLYSIERGFYPNNTLVFLSNDYFLIWEKSRIINQKTNLYVMPHKFKKEGLLIALAVEKIIKIPKRSASLDSYEFKRYRDYQGSDSIKSIDWKKTAKSSKLIVRENYPEQEPHNILIFWGENNSAFEYAVALFYSMYEEINQTAFEEFYLLGETSFHGPQIEKKWMAFLDPFEDFEQTNLLSSIKDRNIFIFSANDSPLQNQTISFLKQHNEVIRLSLREYKLLSIISEHWNENVNLGGQDER